MSIFSGLFNKSKVVVSSINVKWRGNTHSLGRMPVNGKTFEISIPFQNKPQDDYSFLKAQAKPPVTIKNIVVKEPFKLVSVTPTVPASINENEKTIFKVKLEAPQYNYEGPLDVELISEATDLVHVEISKIGLKTPDNSIEIKDKPKIMDVSRGQVFKQNLHLYGAVNIGTEIKKIEILPPFTFVSSDPKIPFKIDNKTGFLIDIYVQAPQSNYGGPLEITMS